jgi:prepilin-type processing-associated H-X9-DG protein
METYFIEYLLNTLDDDQRRQIEAYLEQDPHARRKLALLKQALEPLAADAERPVAPPQLVERTLARIAEQICVTQPAPQVVPAPPAPLPSRGFWRPRLDVLVAACLLVTVVGIGLTILGRMRGPTSAAVAAECKENLRQFYVALQTYRDQHGQLPDVAKQSPRDVAGMVVPMLNEAGTLPHKASIRCPGLGSPAFCPFSVSALLGMSDADFEMNSPNLSMSYAYSLGYRDEAGVHHGPGAILPVGWSQTPIMADRPPAEGLLLNSMNHGGAGQNVLFADGHVHFLPERTYGEGDDIFLNRDGKIAAGLGVGDIVLGYSGARP